MAKRHVAEVHHLLLLSSSFCRIYGSGMGWELGSVALYSCTLSVVHASGGGGQAHAHAVLHDLGVSDLASHVVGHAGGQHLLWPVLQACL